MTVAFKFNNRIYIRAIPSKRLFNSSMVHEVVNRGDVFALDVETNTLTIIPGTSQVEHIKITHMFEGENCIYGHSPEEVIPE